MRRDRIHLAMLLAAATIAGPVWAQTSTTTSSGTSSTGSSSSTTTSTGTSSSTSTGTSTSTGAFQSLSPGQQKIARALFEAQQPTASGPAPLSLDQIAALKNGTGWGQVFKQMKSEGLVGDAKNLGQVVSGHATTHAPSSSTSTTVTTASGRPVGSGGSSTATGNATQGHGNSAHVSEAHVATSAGSEGNHGGAGSNAHAH